MPDTPGVRASSSAAKTSTWLELVALKFAVTVCQLLSKNSPRKIGFPGSLSMNTPKLLPFAPLALTCKWTSTETVYARPGVNPATVCEAVGSELDSPQAFSCIDPGGFPIPLTHRSSPHPPPRVQPFELTSNVPLVTRLAGTEAVIVVGSEAESLEVLVSPPPDTTAVFVTFAGALLATFTVTVIAG